MSRRLRFAPSPTGSLHVGNARTALVNWLIAQREGGTLVLRIEDTDAERSDAGRESGIVGDLAWLGIGWDEGPDIGGGHGPYRQSERGRHYDEATRRLLDCGAAYPSFESKEEVAAQREAAQREGKPFRFRGAHRDASPQECAELLVRGGAALRFKVPDEREITFVDELRGATGVATSDIGDFVVARADGTPTYNLAVVVDDHEMGIDLVVRGEDHLTNTPRQILLYEALGWRPPTFLHLPLVLGPDRSRLSKRHGATSVADMRESGILPEALCNFLVLLGWSPPGEDEVLTPEALREAYDVADVSTAASIFDQTKLEWLNGQHMARMKPGELLARAVPFLGEAGIVITEGAQPREWLARCVALIGAGKRRLDQLAGPLEQFLHPDWSELVAATAELRDDEAARAVLQHFAEASRAGTLRTAAGYDETVTAVREATGAGGRKLFHPLRLAISGAEQGPELKQLVPLIEEGAALHLDRPVPGIAERIEHVLNADA